MLPIMSQANLNSFIKKFVENMPQQFLVLWTMLIPMHGSLSIYCYESNQNSHTFSWWALCNAAAWYGNHDVQAWSNLSVHYGISIVQSTLQHKLSSFHEYSILMKACESKLLA
jgi:hypothetical protein